jgi:hypothetical protein
LAFAVATAIAGETEDRWWVSSWSSKPHSQDGIMRLPYLALGLMALAQPSGAWGLQAFDRSRDRGPGLPTSMFGTYIQRGELLVYPFFEYYYDNNAEYSPSELGFGLDQDFRGKFRASEGLIFLGYGLSDRLAVEFEAAIISAKQQKAANDPSSMPAEVKESGVGDVEAQFRWRWNRETESRPEIFSYFETVFPVQRGTEKRLIGTRDWEFKLGGGIVRGFRWGTATVRLAAEYDGAEESITALGEYAVEYLRRISPGLRLFGAIEGTEDEVELIAEAQVFLRPNIFLKLNNAIGLTSKATDWAPEIGVMFSFR